MNVLDLKRAAAGNSYRWSDRGTDSTGTGSGNTGGSDSGGMGSNNGGGGDTYNHGGSGSSSSYSGSGLSLGFAGLGFGAGLSYSGAGTTSLGSGLSSTSTGGGYTGGNGLSVGGDAGSYGFGGALGQGLNAYGLGLSVSQRIGMNDYLSKADDKDKSLIAKIVDIALSVAVPVTTVLSLISKATTDKTLGQHLAGLVSTGELSSGQAQAFGSALSNGGFNLGGNGGSDSYTGGAGIGNSGSAGTTTNSGGSTVPTGPLDDIFSSFVMPEYDGDPSGMVAGGKQFMTDYNTTYKPYAQKMMSEVDRIGTPEYLAQQREMAMADVQSQYDNTMQQNQRGLSRMGVNPSSGRMLAMQNQGAIQNAASKVGAAAKAEGMVRGNYLSGLDKINTMGMDMSKAGQGWANIGNDAAKTKSAYGIAGAELGLKSKAQQQANAVSWGQISANRYATDRGVQQTQMGIDGRADAAREDNLWDIGGLALQSWLKPSTTSSASNWWET